MAFWMVAHDIPYYGWVIFAAMAETRSLKKHESSTVNTEDYNNAIEALYWAKGFGKNGEVHDKMIMNKIDSVIKNTNHDQRRV